MTHANPALSRADQAAAVVAPGNVVPFRACFSVTRPHPDLMPYMESFEDFYCGLSKSDRERVVWQMRTVSPEDDASPVEFYISVPSTMFLSLMRKVAGWEC
jgi:hypothetical protein